MKSDEFYGQEVADLIYVAVVGGGESDTELLNQAEITGKEIARRGAVLVCGGGSGVMEAAARGATMEGGQAIGILPGNTPQAGNKYLTAAIATGLGEARNAIITRSAHGVVAVNGEYGTLSEIALALKMNKPVVGIKTWKLEDPYGVKANIIFANNGEEAVNKILNLVKH